MKLTTEEAMKNPRLWAAIEKAAKNPPSVPQEAKGYPESGAMPFPLVPAKAKGRTRKVPGQMNKLEQQYAQHLEAEKRAGRILEYYYEALAFKLAPKTFWHPDFLVLTAGHFIEVHECKGFMEDHANVKIKATAAKFWWLTVKIVRRVKVRDGGGWKIEEIPGA